MNEIEETERLERLEAKRLEAARLENERVASENRKATRPANLTKDQLAERRYDPTDPNNPYDPRHFGSRPHAGDPGYIEPGPHATSSLVAEAEALHAKLAATDQVEARKCLSRAVYHLKEGVSVQPAGYDGRPAGPNPVTGDPNYTGRSASQTWGEPQPGDPNYRETNPQLIDLPHTDPRSPHYRNPTPVPVPAAPMP